MKKKSFILNVIICMLIPVLSACSRETPKPVAPVTPWPTGGWHKTAPEKQGIDSALLADMFDFITANKYHIRSLIIIRNRSLVTEAYVHPFRANAPHVIHSCSKSITSALVGIALQKKILKSIDSLVVNYYPIRDYPDIRKKRITLRHLLTMSAGLDTRDSYRYDFQGLMQMMRTSDWDKFILALPMKAAPGSRFEYSNSVTYLIASILQDRTGRDALSFAQQHLFRPMGIADTDVGWRKSPKGICLGWGGIRMKPLDLAKFGLLYLNNGRWNKQQLVPEAWVKDSTCNQINALTLCDGYGYQWWIDNDGHYMALGYGGQYLFVLPAKNMVVVVNSAMAGGDFFVPQMLLKRFILPAANSPTPLKENKKDQTRLKKKLNLLANPKPSPVPPLPKTALSISGKRFQFAPNSLGLDQIEFSFQKGKPEALLNLSVPFGAFQVAVGLDGVHRIKNAIGLIQAHKGTWLDESSFVVHRESINFTQRARVVFRFRGDTLTVSAEQVFSDNYELNARMVK